MSQYCMYARAGVTDWQCGAAPRSTLRSASADLQQAQGERPLPEDGFRLGASSVGGRFAYSRLLGAGMIRLRRTGSHRVGEGFVD